MAVNTTTRLFFPLVTQSFRERKYYVYIVMTSGKLHAVISETETFKTAIR